MSEELDAVRVELALLRRALLRIIQTENSCAATGEPCKARRCGCLEEQRMLVMEEASRV
jgi:hypothetical protein